MNDKLLLTIPEAARALSLGRSKTYQLVSAGELPSVHIGRSVRVEADALADFVKKLREGDRELVEA